MITHILLTFSKLRFKLTEEQTAIIQDMLDHPDEVSHNDYITINGSRVHFKSIEGLYPIDKFPEERVTQAYHPFLELPQPRNRFTHIQNMERMRESAIASKKSEQAKYGVKPWSTTIDNWLHHDE